MDLGIEYAPSALKHKGITKERIEHALMTRKWEKPEDDGSFLGIGYDMAGNPLEIGFRENDDGSLYVFHAMIARKKWREAAGI